MRILVDADALPGEIKTILYRAVRRENIPLTMVANHYINVPSSELFDSIAVPAGADVADDKIVEIVVAGDLVVTADIPLADRVIEKDAHAIDPRGQLHTKETIKERLALRDFMEQLRSTGVETGGPSSFSKKDVQQFANQLDRFLTKYRNKSS